MDNDQILRTNMDKVSYYYNISFDYHIRLSDSLKWCNRLDTLPSMMKNGYETSYTNYSYHDTLKRHYYKQEISRLNTAQNLIDDINVKELISITKKYGYPSNERLNQNLNVRLIFMHADRKDFKQIEKVVRAEVRKGRMSDKDCGYIYWHLDGRNILDTEKKCPYKSKILKSETNK